MDTLRIETMSQTPQSAAEKAKQKNEKVAQQFEAVFVKTLVSSLRQTATLGGEEGGMFGKGPGADTYADWFDNNVSEELSRTGGIGIATALLEEMGRNQRVASNPAKQLDATADEAARAARIADGSDLRAASTIKTGGIDVVR